MQLQEPVAGQRNPVWAVVALMGATMLSSFGSALAQSRPVGNGARLISINSQSSPDILTPAQLAVRAVSDLTKDLGSNQVIPEQRAAYEIQRRFEANKLTAPEVKTISNTIVDRLHNDALWQSFQPFVETLIAIDPAAAKASLPGLAAGYKRQLDQELAHGHTLNEAALLPLNTKYLAVSKGADLVSGGRSAIQVKRPSLDVL